MESLAKKQSTHLEKRRYDTSTNIHKATMSTESTTNNNSTTSSELQYYTCDPVALDTLRKSCPWKDEPSYFKKVSLSPSSVMKMVCVFDSLSDGAADAFGL